MKILHFLFVASLLAVPPAPSFAADPMATAPTGAAKFPEMLATSAQLDALRKGGFTLYLRHSRTDNTRPDRVPSVDLDDCNTQRPLTEEGRKLAAQVGAFVRKARIPLDDVHISPLCRVKDTTAAAFPALPHRIDNNLMYVANLTVDQKAPIITRTRELLSMPVHAGKNRLIIAHAPNMMDLIGYFPKEATLIVFRPLGKTEGFEYIASIPPEHWQKLMP